MTTPEHINKDALNKACVSKWKKQKIINEQQYEDTMNPNCLNVEKATIFFKSMSKLAIIPAIKIVNTLNKINHTQLFNNMGENRIKR
jgi:hypothetical protein